MEVCVTSTADASKKKPSAWAIVGCVLLAIYLPPVLAIAIVNRWKDVEARLRTAAIVLSFLFPAGAALYLSLERSPWRALAYPLFGYTPILMHAAFILCWHRHRGTAVSRILKACFWLALILVTFGAIMLLVAFGYYVFTGFQRNF